MDSQIKSNGSNSDICVHTQIHAKDTHALTGTIFVFPKPFSYVSCKDYTNVPVLFISESGNFCVQMTDTHVATS